MGRGWDARIRVLERAGRESDGSRRVAPRNGAETRRLRAVFSQGLHAGLILCRAAVGVRRRRTLRVKRRLDCGDCYASRRVHGESKREPCPRAGRGTHGRQALVVHAAKFSRRKERTTSSNQPTPVNSSEQFFDRRHGQKQFQGMAGEWLESPFFVERCTGTTFSIHYDRP